MQHISDIADTPCREARSPCRSSSTLNFLSIALLQTFTGVDFNLARIREIPGLKLAKQVLTQSVSEICRRTSANAQKKHSAICYAADMTHMSCTVCCHAICMGRMQSHPIPFKISFKMTRTHNHANSSLRRSSVPNDGHPGQQMVMNPMEIKSQSII